ncbi:MAG: glycosyltransferase family 4 protein [Chthoniobacterales bacterium]
MRIGLVRRGYSPAGGAESYLRGFAQAALAAGHETVFFCSPEWQDWAFGEMIRVAGKSPRAFSDQLAALRPKEKCDVLFSLERVSQCDFYRAGDGVHAAWLKRRAEFESPLRRLTFAFNPKHRALLRLEKESITGARCVIANSEMVRREIAENYGSSIRVEVVRNGIDPLKWAVPSECREALRKRFELQPNDRVAVFVGSGWERKGLRFAIAAAREAGCILLVSGKGHAESFHAPQVRFLGPTDQVADVLHAADAFILPTIYDPFSNATLEALAAGLPIITTTANGVSEILDPESDGTAVTSPGDVSALAAALKRWLPDQNTAIRQSHGSRFTLERNFAETLRIIES